MSGKSSYDFDDFSAQQSKDELERLRQQAFVVAALELPRLAALGLNTATRILDMGCGPGFITRQIAAQCPKARVMGLDSSRDLLKVAQASESADGQNLSFHHGNVYETGLDDNQFDFIYNRFVYQHLETPVKALNEAVRITQPGGRICIVDIDDTLLLIHPKMPALDTVRDMACQAKSRTGGDRNVGRKLAGFMARAGIGNIQVRMECITSLDIGWENFLDVSVRFRYHYAMTQGDKAKISELESALNAAGPDAFGLAGIIIAVGDIHAE